MPAIHPEFIDSDGHRIFLLHRPAARPLNQSECIIVAPSFAEEMNRCRYMCTMLAQAITPDGFGLINVDFRGTGDSSGEFVDADWVGWKADLVAAANHALSLGYRSVSVLAIRIGALLLMESKADLPPLRRILFWQPVTNGKAALTQFLRIRIAASIDRDEDAGTIASFKDQIARGESVEVAGYDVGPGVFNGLESANFNGHLEQSDIPVGWFTTVASAERSPTKAELNVIEKWRDAGTQIDHHVTIGPQYWAAHERTLDPLLVETTAGYLRKSA